MALVGTVVGAWLRVLDQHVHKRALGVGLHPDGATVGAVLDTVVYRVFDQRLKAQWRYGLVLQGRGDGPFHLQALTQAQAFDGQVAPAQVEFPGQGNLLVVGAQAGAEQLGQIQHRVFGLVRVAGNEAGDAVHAVEQEMGLDARLQGGQLRLHLRLALLLPLVLQVKVAQHHQGDQCGQQQFLGNALPVRTAGGGVQDPVGKQAEGQDIEQHNRQDRHGGAAGGQAREPGAQQADQRGTGQGGPLHEQRQQAEVAPVNPALRGLDDGQDQHQ